MAPHHFFVGTFDTPVVFTLAFDVEANSLQVVAKSEATGAHSWLSLNSDRTRLYATAWTTPPGLAAYKVIGKSIDANGATVPALELINSVETRARSGYCCNSAVAVYSAGGPTGEVFSIDSETGGFAVSDSSMSSGSARGVLQKLEFVDSKGQKDDGGTMDFGGLRHGAHSADLSPDGKRLYIADIGRNCVFVYSVAKDGTLTLTDKNIAPRPDDGPRHVTPHPNGRFVYSLQEHTSMVDVFEVSDDGRLSWRQGVKIIPKDLSPSLFWADEVRLSPAPSSPFLYASTRGLEPSQKGYVAVFKLLPSGLFETEEPLAMYQMPTSGGWAGAIEPAPKGISDLSIDQEHRVTGMDYLALTDSEKGFVLILSWDGTDLKELAKVQLEGGAGAATSVWAD